MENKRSIVYMIRCRHVRSDGTECGDKEVDTAPTAYRTNAAAKRNLHAILANYAAYVTNIGRVQCCPPHTFHDGCARSMVYVADGYLTAEVFPLVLADEYAMTNKEGTDMEKNTDNGKETGVCYVAEYSEDWGFGGPPERGTFRRVHESRDAALKYLNECVEEGKERMGDETCEGVGAIHVEAVRGVDGIRFYIEGGADFTYWIRKCEFIKG